MTSFRSSFQSCYQGVRSSQGDWFEIKSYLSRWGLGEPQGPGVGERVLDIEVIGVMKDGDDVASKLLLNIDAALATGGSHGNCVERDGRGGHG